MKSCTVCNNTQASGNFCGKCGGPLESEVAATNNPATPNSFTQPTHTNIQQPSSTEVTVQSNEQLDQLKEHSKAYFTYFVQQLKSPSTNAHEVSNQKNHLTSLIVYMVLTAISIYSLLNSTIGASAFSIVTPSFFQILLYSIIFLAILIGVSLVSIYITSKLFSDTLTFKNILSKIGSYFALPITLSAVGILLSILGSNLIASFSVYIGICLAVGLTPLYVMIKQLQIKTKGIDGFYAFLFYLIVTAIIGAIIGVFIMDSTIGDMLDYI